MFQAVDMAAAGLLDTNSLFICSKKSGNFRGVQLWAMAENAPCLSLATPDVWRIEDKVAKKDGAPGNCSMSLFALSFLQKVR
jgi:hypothetical protein